MADFLTPQERSERMSRIRSKDTSPELALRCELHRLGLRYTLKNSRLPGKPDLVFPRYRAIVFVHGCFWHRHAGCNIATTPKSNTPFWQAKFERNVDRDRRVIRELAGQGWRIYVAWECDLQSRTRAKATAEHIAQLVRSVPSAEP